MSSPNEPIRRLKKRIALTWAFGLTAALPVAWWSFVAPVGLVSLDTNALSRETESSDSGGEVVTELHAMAESGFNNVRLFNPPPSAEGDTTSASQKTNASPFRLQLIGIVSEDGVHKAALYDPNEDHLFIVTDGERVGSQYEIVRVTADSVEVAEGTRRHRLVLDPAHSIGNRGPQAGREVLG